jgi:hypothetical protein
LCQSPFLGRRQKSRDSQHLHNQPSHAVAQQPQPSTHLFDRCHDHLNTIAAFSE